MHILRQGAKLKINICKLEGKRLTVLNYFIVNKEMLILSGKNKQKTQIGNSEEIKKTKYEREKYLPLLII